MLQVKILLRNRATLLNTIQQQVGGGVQLSVSRERVPATQPPPPSTPAAGAAAKALGAGEVVERAEAAVGGGKGPQMIEVPYRGYGVSTPVFLEILPTPHPSLGSYRLRESNSVFVFLCHHTTEHFVKGVIGDWQPVSLPLFFHICRCLSRE